MKITIKFPRNEDVEFELGKPIVILGANGSGKTRFAVKIEELNDKKFKNWSEDGILLIHRISAQKNLSINDSISILDHESSSRTLFYGDQNIHAQKFGYRYGNNPATFLLDDFNKALSLLFAEANQQLQDAHEADKTSFKSGRDRPEPVTTVVEEVTAIWNEILPKRTIDLKGNGVHVTHNFDQYHGKEMSDGERVILYMICQVLVLKKNSILIIDEPELHIHKAIVNKLWDKLELARPDCVFMYITHDITFALSRNSERVLWIKEYSGTEWIYEFLEISNYSDIPHELLYELIGTRQKVLFVEGDKNSYDHFLYQEIYKDKGFHVIPCGSCGNVIKIVKSKQAYANFSSIEVYGVIDRDFRTDAEIDALKKQGVFCIEVAEVENLFVVPGILEIMEEQMACQEGTANEAEDFIKRLFMQNIDNQIGDAFINEINHKMKTKNFSYTKLLPEDIKKHLDTEFSLLELNGYFELVKQRFDKVTTTDEILRIFNFKDLSKKIGTKFGLKGNDYPQRVINLLKKNPNDVRVKMLEIFANYVPTDLDIQKD